MVNFKWENWICEEPEVDKKYRAKIRYLSSEEKCFLQKEDDTWLATFEKSIWAVTPGQSIVIYDGDFVLGGGIICK